MATNLHYYFNKRYFDGIGIEVRENRGRRELVVADLPYTRNCPIKEYRLPAQVPALFHRNLPYTHLFEFEVGYPGLVTGVGLGHEINAKGEFKLGMHFDFTYGIPVIYGSSIKGVLHSHFRDFTDHMRIEDGKLELYVSPLTRNDAKGYRVADYPEFSRMLEKSIFGSSLDTEDEEHELGCEYQDVFFDAVPYAENKTGSILSADYLCPHGESPYKNPIPISFLRISPGVKIRLAFQLRETTLEWGGKTIPVTQKFKYVLFKNMLSDLGLGAKTNVGYGVLTPISVSWKEADGSISKTTY